MVVNTEVTTVFAEILEVAVGVVGDEEDGVKIAVIEAVTQSVTTEPQEMIEVLHFGTIGAVNATGGSGMILLEDAEHHLLKAVVVRPTTALVKLGMHRQP